MNVKEQLRRTVKEQCGKDISAASDRELYNSLLVMTKVLLENKPKIEGKKRVYYISAEFLIGKLLSNNLINLGIYEDIYEELKEHGKELSVIEELEPEPSLGNGGLGRLAACFLDSIASLGLPGDGIGLNYHFGLFRQSFRDKLQYTEKDEWMEDHSWLNKTGVTFPVYFGDKKVISCLYDIDVVGYDNLQISCSVWFVYSTRIRHDRLPSGSVGGCTSNPSSKSSMKKPSSPSRNGS